MADDKFDLSFFEENIDTEFQQPYRKTLKVKALKTDAQNKSSLKNRLSLSKVKSCDYIKLIDNQCFLIEFTDLQRQEHGAEQLLHSLKSKLCPVDKENQRKCVAAEAGKVERMFKAKDLVFVELRQKCIESTLLLHRIADLNDFILTKKYKNKSFLVVVKDMTPADTPAFQALNAKLKDSLLGVVDNVKIIPQERLESYLEKAG